MTCCNLANLSTRNINRDQAQHLALAVRAEVNVSDNSNRNALVATKMLVSDVQSAKPYLIAVKNANATIGMNTN